MPSTSQNRRRGYDVEKEVSNGFDIAGLTYFKVPDGHTLRMQTTLKAPADFMLTCYGQILTVEVKTTKSARFPWPNIKQHQLDWVLANPSSAFLLVNFNNRKRGSAALNESFVVGAKTLKKWRNEYVYSIPLTTFREEALPVQRHTASQNPLRNEAYIDASWIL